jgi:hypothetical protein
MRSEGDEPRRLFPLISLQNLLHRTLQVVVPDLPKHPAEIPPRPFVRLWERAMKIQEVILRAMAKKITWRQAEKRAAWLAGKPDETPPHWPCSAG